ncbi:MAG: hypothetical protein FWD82_11080 [Defluviitaleaceae bacterium]|nr:hypothetical protein [Defluviitaleaceae bacterium]
MTTDNLIVIKGGAYNDVKKALRQWINLYSKDLQDDLVFNLFKSGRGEHIIQVDERLNNDLFFYLVNYLEYPEGINYKINIEGFTTGKENNILKDKKMLVYISPIDKEGDNVFVTTSENENFKVDFGGKITAIRNEKKFEQPVGLLFENPEILKIDQREFKQKQKVETSHNLDKRFKIISIILIILYLSTFFIHFVLRDEFLFYMSTITLSVGIWWWLLWDLEMLLDNKGYLKCLGVAVLCWIYGIVLSSQAGTSAFMGFGLLPLSGLVMQKPARYIHLRLFKEEPILSYNVFYSIILLLGSVALTISITSIIKNFVIG